MSTSLIHRELFGFSTRMSWVAGTELPESFTIPEGTFATWRSGRLRYRDESLVVIICDLQRYFPGRIELVDPSLGELRVTGTFTAMIRRQPVTRCRTSCRCGFCIKEPIASLSNAKCDETRSWHGIYSI